MLNWPRGREKKTPLNDGFKTMLKTYALVRPDTASFITKNYPIILKMAAEVAKTMGVK